MTDILGKYSFLPWLRQGLARDIDPVDFPDQEELPAEVRPKVEALVNLEVEGIKVGEDSYSKLKVNEVFPNSEDRTFQGENILQQVQMVGPGEVTGIQRRAIVKEEPRNGITNFEPNYLPYIEFYEEDFPWRYTPATPDATKPDRLRPWLTLIVLEESEFDPANPPDALLPAIEITGNVEAVFPKKDQTWAWAHVHVNKELDLEIPLGAPTDDGARGTAAAQSLFKLISKDPNCASSRLLCSRRLRSNASYHAFLVPAFEQGRLAGLGAKPQEIAAADVQKCSWDTSGNRFLGSVWPYYHTWYFSTGDKLDFEYLVRIIDPIDLSTIPAEIGRREMDLQESGYLLNYQGGSGSVLLEGALELPGATRDDFLDVAVENKANYVEQLQHIVNLSELWTEEEAPPSYAAFKEKIFQDQPDEQALDDPIVTPPLYGKWHIKLPQTSFALNEPDDEDQKLNWFHQVNLDPRNRVAAGFGTNTVQNDQEQLMDRAWEQVGRVLDAIRMIRRGQFSAASSDRLFQHYFFNLNPSNLLSLTSAIHSKVNRVVEDVSQTVLSTFKGSSLPTGLFSQGFNKVFRPNGPMVNRSGFNPGTLTNGAGSLIQDMVLNQGEIFKFPDLAGGGLVFEADPVDQIVGGIDPGGEFVELGNRPGGFFNFNPNWQGLNNDFLLDFLIVGIRPRSLAPPEQLEALKEVLTETKSFFGQENWKGKAEGAELPTSEIEQIGIFLKERLQPIPLIEDIVLGSVNFRLIRQVIAVRSGRDNVAVDRALAAGTPRPDKMIEPLVYPEFPDPMYRALRDTSSELLLPGIEHIPQNSFSILKTNRHFIESYMLGLNHEMARELLWREYPTDQRGSYFRQFWEIIDNRSTGTDTKDISSIHRWCSTCGPDPESIIPTRLGHNLPSIDPTAPVTDDDAGRLVFVVRGELLKKFPNTLIYLQRAKAERDDEGRCFRTLDREADILTPIFRAKVDPDITFLGFDGVDEEDAHGDPFDPECACLDRDDPDLPDECSEELNLGYYVVVRERPGEVRFGLDLPTEDFDASFLATSEWNNLHWGHLTTEEGQYIDLNQICCDDDGNPLPAIDVNDRESILANDSLNKPVEEMEEPHEEASGREPEHMHWGKNAAHNAGIFLQLPFMVAIHASEMITLNNDDQV